MCERAVKVKKGLLGLKRSFCGRSVCQRDFEENLTFWRENWDFGKNECVSPILDGGGGKFAPQLDF